MSMYLRRPTVVGQISTTKSRLFRVERRLAMPQPKVPPYVAKWSIGGIPTLTESGSETHPFGGNLVRVYATLRSPGTSPTVISVRKNGVEIAELIMTPWADYNDVFMNVPFVAQRDAATVAVTAVGDNAVDLAVFGEFDR